MPALANPVKHHEAMPSADVPAFFAILAASGTPAARALQWTILTAARAGETLGMTWGEIDKALWAIPGVRMKAGKDHTVPLAPEALALLGDRGKPEALVFGHLDDRALRVFVRDRGCRVHGFRSTFAVWAAESGWELELRKLALAHAVSGATAQAYNRSQQVDRRRAMMTAWARFATETP